MEQNEEREKECEHDTADIQKAASTPAFDLDPSV